MEATWADATPGEDHATNGLAEDEVLRRRARGEGNQLALSTSRSYAQILRANFLSAVNLILFTLGLTLLALGQATDAFFTAGIVFVNGLLGTVQEIRAKRLLDRIALLNLPRAMVIRAGREYTVGPEEVVRGDLLAVGRGDQIVADGQVVLGGMEVDESLLTGEADSVAKGVGAPVYSGSFCTSGGARYVATQIGAGSLVNQLTARARAFRQIHTPLQREIDLLARVMLLVVLFLGLLVALMAGVNHLSLLEYLQMSSVTAGLVPNGLILTVTTAYALGAVRMAGRGALLQRTNAVESLSNVDMLCLDKTGTLTANRLAVQGVRAVGMPEAACTRLLGDYAASVSTPDTTSLAIAAAYRGHAHPVREEVAFSSARKWSALRMDSGSFVLGAPEILLPDAPLDVAVEGWLADGLRVLLFAQIGEDCPLPEATVSLRLTADLRPLGFVALRDELRPEAEATLRGFRQAGIRVKIISGDHIATVSALARQAGVGESLASVSGAELTALEDDQFAQVVEAATIFGRVSPQQKERLVEILRAHGHYVAMIGDGVNDVLSLKKADLGIAMQSGSAATRGVADMVLLNDSFAALPVAFEEGQRIRNGMRDCLGLYLTRLLYFPPLILAIGLVTGTFAFSPRTTALIALLTVGIPPLALVVWAQAGAQPKQGMIRSLVPFVFPAGLAMTLLGLGVYVALFFRHMPMGALDTVDARANDAAAMVARSALVMAMVLGGLALILFLRGPTATWTLDKPRGTLRLVSLVSSMFGLYLLVLWFPFTREFFDVVALEAAEYALIGAAVLVWALLLRWTLHARVLERFLGIRLG